MQLAQPEARERLQPEELVRPQQVELERQPAQMEPELLVRRQQERRKRCSCRPHNHWLLMHHMSCIRLLRHMSCIRLLCRMNCIRLLHHMSCIRRSCFHMSCMMALVHSMMVPEHSTKTRSMTAVADSRSRELACSVLCDHSVDQPRLLVPLQ